MSLCLYQQLLLRTVVLKYRTHKMRKFHPQYLEKKPNHFNKTRTCSRAPIFGSRDDARRLVFLTWAQGKVRTLSGRGYFQRGKNRAAVENSHSFPRHVGCPPASFHGGRHQAARGLGGGFASAIAGALAPTACPAGSSILDSTSIEKPGNFQ